MVFFERAVYMPSLLHKTNKLTITNRIRLFETFIQMLKLYIYI